MSARGRHERLVAVVVIVLVGGLLLVRAAPAGAETRTYAFTSQPQTFVVPAAVRSVDVVARGARGGDAIVPSFPNSFLLARGGPGATVTGRIAVVPGEVLQVIVGGDGNSAPACCTENFNGSGAGGAGTGQGGASGGGATDLRRIPTGEPGTLGSRLIVAGGGGGAGGGTIFSMVKPGAGGAAGSPGATVSGGPAPGAAATATDGGPGGAGAPAGTLGQGGTGGAGTYGGGGGGGGLAGGGGGAPGASTGGGGGGGGSSLLPAGGLLVGDPAATSGLVITYEPEPALMTDVGTLRFAPQAAGTASAQRSVTLRNEGSAALHVGATTVTGGDAGDFRIGRGCDEPVPSGASCRLPVSFVPVGTTVGVRAALLQITSDDPSSPRGIALAGSVPEPPPTSTPTTPTTPPGAPAPPVTTTVTTTAAPAVAVPVPVAPVVIAVPVLGALSLSSSRFRVGPRPRGAPRSVRSGTSVRFTSSVPATATLLVERRVRRRGRTTYTRTGATSAAIAVGANTVRLTGRVAGRRFARGSYRLTLTAMNAAGTSAKRTATFTVVR